MSVIHRLKENRRSDFISIWQQFGPTGPNSRLAWHGEYSAGGKQQPLYFCLTALKNPKPFLEVTSIDLYSRKCNSTACIMAMTAGQSGLMR